MEKEKTITTCLFGLVLAVLFNSIMRGNDNIFNYFELLESQKILEKAINDIESEIKSAEEEITKIKSSPNYAEKVLKDRFHVIDKNEKIIFFADD